MIQVTKLNDEIFVINCSLIESVYQNPDTTIHLQGGKMYIVKESMPEVIELSRQYQQSIFAKFL